MSGRPASQKSVMEHREREAAEGEPLVSHQRKVQQEGDDGSLYQNIPADAAGITDLEKGDELAVHVFSWGYVVEPAESGE